MKTIALAAGMMSYSLQSIEQYRTWLSEVPFDILVTRDEKTYTHVHDLAEYSYNGIDTAFFVSDFFFPPKMRLGTFVALNFDKWPEPKIWNGDSDNYNLTANYQFEFDGKRWYVQFPHFRTTLAKKSRVFQFLNSWLPQKRVRTLGEYPIVRTDHRFNPVMLRNIFGGPNTFAMDVPQSYLTIYANAALTLTNRVHACVASLAYGNQAMLFSKTPRVALLDRVGAQKITQRPVRLDMQYLTEEKNRLIEFLRAVRS